MPTGLVILRSQVPSLLQLTVSWGTRIRRWFLGVGQGFGLRCKVLQWLQIRSKRIASALYSAGVCRGNIFPSFSPVGLSKIGIVQRTQRFAVPSLLTNLPQRLGCSRYQCRIIGSADREP